jgi:hypothetical protein
MLGMRGGGRPQETRLAAWRTRSGGRGEMTGNAKRIRFCFNSVPPTVELLLSRKISSVEYAVISSLQDTFGSLLCDLGRN